LPSPEGSEFKVRVRSWRTSGAISRVISWRGETGKFDDSGYGELIISDLSRPSKVVTQAAKDRHEITVVDSPY